jgi:hypothetical protein
LAARLSAYEFEADLMGDDRIESLNPFVDNCVDAIHELSSARDGRTISAGNSPGIAPAAFRRVDASCTYWSRPVNGMRTRYAISASPHTRHSMNSMPERVR